MHVLVPLAIALGWATVSKPVAVHADAQDLAPFPAGVTVTTTPRQSDIDRDLPFRPNELLTAWPPGINAPSAAAVFIDKNIASPYGTLDRKDWTLLLLASGSNGTTTTHFAASLNLTMPWTMLSNASGDGRQTQWIPPTTLRVNPAISNDVREDFMSAFKRISMTDSRSHGGHRLIPLSPTNVTGGGKAVMAFPEQGQVGVVPRQVQDAQGDNPRMELVVNVNATASEGGRNIDWGLVSTSSVAGQRRVSDLGWSYVLDKYGQLYSIDAEGTHSIPIDSRSTSIPSPRTQASLVQLSPSRLLLLTGGFNGSHSLDDVWVFDLRAYNWTQLTNVRLSSPRHGHQVAIVDMDSKDGSRRDLAALVFPGKDAATMDGGRSMPVDAMYLSFTADQQLTKYKPFRTMHIPIQMPPGAAAPSTVPMALPIVIQDSYWVGSMVFNTFLLMYYPPVPPQQGSSEPIPLQLFRVAFNNPELHSRHDLSGFIPQSYYWPMHLYMGKVINPSVVIHEKEEEEARARQRRRWMTAYVAVVVMMLFAFVGIGWSCIRCCQGVQRENAKLMAKWKQEHSGHEGEQNPGEGEEGATGRRGGEQV